MNTDPPETNERTGFWTNAIKYRCFYDCASCTIKKSAIELAKRSADIQELREKLPRTERCEIVVTWSTPWWNPLLGRYNFLIINDRGSHEFFRVIKANLVSLFRRSKSS